MATVPHEPQICMCLFLLWLIDETNCINSTLLYCFVILQKDVSKSRGQDEHSKITLRIIIFIQSLTLKICVLSTLSLLNVKTNSKTPKQPLKMNIYTEVISLTPWVSAKVFVLSGHLCFILDLLIHNTAGVKKSEEQTTEARAKANKTDCEVDKSILQRHSWDSSKKEMLSDHKVFTTCGVHEVY